MYQFQYPDAAENYFDLIARATGITFRYTEKGGRSGNR